VAYTFCVDCGQNFNINDLIRTEDEDGVGDLVCHDCHDKKYDDWAIPNRLRADCVEEEPAVTVCGLPPVVKELPSIFYTLNEMYKGQQKRG